MFCNKCGFNLGNAPTAVCPACQAQPRQPQAQPATPPAAPDYSQYPSNYDWFTGEETQTQVQPQSPAIDYNPAHTAPPNYGSFSTETHYAPGELPPNFMPLSAQEWRQVNGPPPGEIPISAIPPQAFQNPPPPPAPPEPAWHAMPPPQAASPTMPPAQPGGTYVPPAMPVASDIPPLQYSSASMPPPQNYSNYMPPVQGYAPKPAPPKKKRVGKTIALVAGLLSLVLGVSIGGFALNNALNNRTGTSGAGASTGGTPGAAGRGGSSDTFANSHTAGTPNHVYATTYKDVTYFICEGMVLPLKNHDELDEFIRFDENFTDCVRVGDTVYGRASRAGLSGSVLGTLSLPKLELTLHENIPVESIGSDNGQIYIFNDYTMHELDMGSTTLSGKSWDYSHADGNYSNANGSTNFEVQTLVWDNTLFLSYYKDSAYHMEMMDLGSGKISDQPFNGLIEMADQDALYYVDNDTASIIRVPLATYEPEVLVEYSAEEGGIGYMHLDGGYLYFSYPANCEEPLEDFDGVYRVHINTGRIQGIPIPKAGIDFTVFDGWICFQQELFKIEGDTIVLASHFGGADRIEEEEIELINVE